MSPQISAHLADYGTARFADIMYESAFIKTFYEENFYDGIFSEAVFVVALYKNIFRHTHI